MMLRALRKRDGQASMALSNSVAAFRNWRVSCVAAASAKMQ